MRKNKETRGTEAISNDGQKWLKSVDVENFKKNTSILGWEEARFWRSEGSFRQKLEFSTLLSREKI